MRAARATTTLALFAALVYGALAIEEKPEDITVCAACHGHLVFPPQMENWKLLHCEWPESQPTDSRALPPKKEL